MIGEIRDLETASIAINASLTGHLVFSTLHTNDAPGAVARLTDIGVKPFLIASAVRGILAQRLVRKLCGLQNAYQPQRARAALSRPRASKWCPPPSWDPPAATNATRLPRPNGHRRNLQVDDEVRGMVNEQLTTPQLRKRARQLGMRTLREDGIRKVLAGMTTAEEVIEATMSDAD
jgi:type IV pilus assembly protein PilB